MTSLGDKAETPPDIRRPAEAEGESFTITDLVLVGADDIGTDEFPRYGDFLPVVDASGNEAFLECPTGLAASIMNEFGDHAPRTGTRFVIESASKVDGDDGNQVWAFEVEIEELGG